MDDNRRPSGSGEKLKGKANKKKKKTKNKDRERRKTGGKTKAYSPEEINSDSALEWGKRNTKGSQDVNRTSYANAKNSLKNTKGTQSAPVLGSRSTSRITSGISLLDKEGLQAIYAMFAPTEPNKLNTAYEMDYDKLADDMEESLRWEEEKSDPEEEAERIRAYKMNRRKRYLIDAYQRRDDKEEVLKLAKDIATSKD